MELKSTLFSTMIFAVSLFKSFNFQTIEAIFQNLPIYVLHRNHDLVPQILKNLFQYTKYLNPNNTSLKNKMFFHNDITFFLYSPWCF